MVDLLVLMSNVRSEPSVASRVGTGSLFALHRRLREELHPSLGRTRSVSTASGGSSPSLAPSPSSAGREPLEGGGGGEVQVQVPYALLDGRGRMVVVNEAWQRLTGYDALTAAQMPLSLLVGPLSDLVELKTVVDSYRDHYLPADATTFLYCKVTLT
jgi:PAS domain-containing protein